MNDTTRTVSKHGALTNLFLLRSLLRDTDNRISCGILKVTAPIISLSKGIDLATVMTMMDHKYAATTDKYAKMVRDREKLDWAIMVL